MKQLAVPGIILFLFCTSARAQVPNDNERRRTIVRLQVKTFAGQYPVLVMARMNRFLLDCVPGDIKQANLSESVGYVVMQRSYSLEEHQEALTRKEVKPLVFHPIRRPGASTKRCIQVYLSTGQYPAEHEMSINAFLLRIHPEDVVSVSNTAVIYFAHMTDKERKDAITRNEKLFPPPRIMIQD